MNPPQLESCFTNYSEIKEFIPEEYLQIDGDKCWFTKPLKFKAVRLNTIVECQLKQLLDTLKVPFPEIPGDKLYKKPPVYQHEIIRDAVIIRSSLKQPNLIGGSHKEVLVNVESGNEILDGVSSILSGIRGVQAGTELLDDVDVYVDLAEACDCAACPTEYTGEKILVGRGKVLFDELKVESGEIQGVMIRVIQRTSETPPLELSLRVGVVQNLPSIVCSHVLNPTSKDLVLEMCASPGKRTCHLSSLMKNKGMLIALDISEDEVADLKGMFEGLEHKNITCHAWDSTKAVSDIKTKNDFIPPFPPSTFDKIMLNAPSSRLGIRPNLRNKITKSDIESFPPLQKQLISQAVQLLKPGGFLVYNTYTITIEECEKIVVWALKEFPSLKLVRSSPMIGMPGLPDKGLSEIERYYVQRFGSSHENVPEDDTIGFFIAKFTKTEDI